MRQILFALTLLLGIAATVFAQSSLTALEQEAQRLARSDRRVAVSDGVLRTEIPAATAPYVTGGPLATIPALALRADVGPTAQSFHIRAWTDGAGVHALVFAVTAGPGREVREEQIASVFVPLGQSVEIAETEKFNARRITLTITNSNVMARQAIRRVAAPVDLPLPRVPSVYIREIYRGDVPTDPGMRPWQPPAKQ